MAWVFVRLKLALIVNGLRRGWQQALGLVVGTMFALPAALGGFVLFALLGRLPGGGDVLVLLFTGLVVGWMLGPLLAFGVDETLDAGRLVLLPLRPTQLVVGLLAASTVGIAPIATLFALLGTVPGFARAPADVLLAFGAVIVEFALCLLASRAATAWLSNLLRSRRGRDLMVTIGALVGMVGLLAGHISEVLESALARQLLDPLVAPLRWTPPGLAASAVAAAAAGDLFGGIWRLALSVGGGVLVAGFWYLGLRRSMTTAPPPASSATHLTLIPRPLAFLPRTRLGAVVAKELRYLTRHPRRRMQWLMSSVIFVPWLLVMTGSRSFRSPAMVLTAAALVYPTLNESLLQLSWDGPALWTNLVAAGELESDLVGKNAALGLATFALVVPGALLLAAFSGGWAYLPFALLLALAVLGVALGVGNVVSTSFPVPMPQSSGGNLWAAQGGGAGCATGLVVAAANLVQLALISPLVVVGIALHRRPGALAVALVIGLLYGGGLWTLGLRAGSRRLATHAPELLAAVEPDRPA